MEGWPALIVAYLVGGISFSILVCRVKGVDIRAHGSGNPGATNVGRVLGKGWGRAVLLADIAKGFFPTLLLGPAATFLDPTGRAPLAAAAVLGHVYPVTARFAGGKGVATLVGALFALDWRLALLAILLHAVVRKLLGFVSMASVVLAWSVPLLQGLALLLGIADVPGGELHLTGIPVLVFLAAVITWRHRANFRRMRSGMEDRYDDASDEEAPPASP